MKVLGFDIGINSIGWAFVENNELKDCGVRLFTKAENPKTKESLALPRRNARSSRVRLRRRRSRLLSLKHIISKEFGLHYGDYIALDGNLPKAYTGKIESIYKLRYEALSQAISKEDLARVILHIAKHRGYMNKNQKTSQDNEKGAILSAIKENSNKIKHYQTAGEYLYKEFFENLRDGTKEFKNIRNKAMKNKKTGNMESTYYNTILASDLEKELKLILEKQQAYHNYSDTFIKEVLEIAFYQRPLKDFSHLVGSCTFYENEKRACKNSYSAWEFIALGKIINSLESIRKDTGEIFSNEILTQILSEVLDKGSLSYTKLRKMINLDEKVKFKGLKYDKESVEKTNLIEFKKLKEFKKALGEHNLERKTLDEIATRITLTKDENQLKKQLEQYALSQNQINALVELDFNDHINLSFKALYEILPLMEKGKRYDEACNELGLKAKTSNQKSEFLPAFCDSIFAQELTNPIVNRAISEYRKVLNRLLKKYGKMHKIHIELARDAGLSKEARNKIEKEQKENKNINDNAEKTCKEFGLKPNAKNILKIKLWREQGEICAYSGKKITIDDLKEDKALEVDHIYPYSRSYDDSYNNKVLVFVRENQLKLNQTPYEAFGSNQEKWSKIQVLAQKLPYKKKIRILDENFKNKDQIEFISRNLNDTRYATSLIAKYTKEYLEFLPLSDNEDISLRSGEKGSKAHVQTMNGMLTSVLRHAWGFSQKDRNNHLHHALDAIIIAYSTNSIIKAFSDFKKNQEILKAKLYAKKLTSEEYKNQSKFTGFEKYRSKILEKLDSIFVSKPPNKNTKGALHEQTFYSYQDILKEYKTQEGLKRALECGKVRKIGTKYVVNDRMVRLDIFTKDNKFYGIPIYTMDFALGVLPNKVVVGSTDKDKDKKIQKEWKTIDETYDFCFSLYKGDLVLIQKKKMQEPEFAYYNGFDISNASISLEKHDNKFENLTENQKLLFPKAKEGNVEVRGIGIQGLKVFKKYMVTPLGEIQEARTEARQNIQPRKKHGLR
nr:type II CRISPR RNA-guided endonuclease Cas9 [Helicobacter sp. CaF467b]